MQLFERYVDGLPLDVARKVDGLLIAQAYCSRSELASAILSSAIQVRSSPTRDPDGVALDFYAQSSQTDNSAHRHRRDGMSGYR
jgi:metal-responsive CopG/Arc/MetJ family transcriptional regulator